MKPKRRAAKRKGASKEAPPPQLVKYRVEIWREESEDLPEIRLTHFPLTYQAGVDRSGDILLRITWSILRWLECGTPAKDRPHPNFFVADNIWSKPIQTPIQREYPVKKIVNDEEVLF